MRMRECIKCNNLSVAYDGYCGVCREITMIMSEQYQDSTCKGQPPPEIKRKINPLIVLAGVMGGIIIVSLIITAINTDKEQERVRIKESNDKYNIALTNYNNLLAKYQALFQGTTLFFQHTNAMSITFSNDGSFALRVDPSKTFSTTYSNINIVNGLTVSRVAITNQTQNVKKTNNILRRFNFKK